ncbi:pyridoxamine 5'-phosphate oxidase family protein [Halobacteriales archaeon Cl-PHB]
MADQPRDPDTLRGYAMDRDEIDEFLREQGTGVLSLSRDGTAYAIPVSFGFAADSLYFFLLRFGDDSKKLDFVETTDEASFTTYDVEDANKWRSVVVTGPLTEVPDDEAEDLEDVMFDNAEFASLFPYGEPMTEQVRYKLSVETVTGQKGHGYVV